MGQVGCLLGMLVDACGKLSEEDKQDLRKRWEELRENYSNEVQKLHSKNSYEKFQMMGEALQHLNRTVGL